MSKEIVNADGLTQREQALLIIAAAPDGAKPMDIGRRLSQINDGDESKAKKYASIVLREKERIHQWWTRSVERKGLRYYSTTKYGPAKLSPRGAIELTAVMKKIGAKTKKYEITKKKLGRGDSERLTVGDHVVVIEKLIATAWNEVDGRPMNGFNTPSIKNPANSPSWIGFTEPVFDEITPDETLEFVRYWRASWSYGSTPSCVVKNVGTGKHYLVSRTHVKPESKS